MKNNFRFIFIWLLLIGAVLWVVGQAQVPSKKYADITYSEYVRLVKEGRIESVTFQGKRQITGKFKPNEQNGAAFRTLGDTESEHQLKLLEANNLVPNYEEEAKPSFLQTALVSWLPIIAILFIFFLFMRQLQSGSNKALSFGQSRAKRYQEGQTKITFKDVAGCDEAKHELVEIVDFLKNPKKYTKLGGRIPKGVLLIGPPGTGKTLLAKAVAGEAGVPFFSISGSDFVEMFVGVGASRVRSLFDTAKKGAPCLIFIDEIDAVGRHRGAGLGGGHDEREQTLNQLLVEMDGFEGNDGIILIAATNRVDVLDPALLRPGRFDRRVMVGKPDLKGRLEILKVHTRKTPLAPEVDLNIIARGTPGFVGADIENLVNESALHAAHMNKNSIDLSDFENAKDKVLMGSPRKSMILTEEERRYTAIHEAGHAIVAKFVPGNDPVHKVTIIPRGPALGVTMTLPEKDEYSFAKSKAEALISYMMGGRVAEQIVFGHLTTGASNDIEKATELARRMVTEWGMSEKVGPLNYAQGGENPFLGREISRGSHLSEETSRLIDEEIRLIVEKNHERAKDVLTKNRKILDKMADSLMEYETLDATDLEELFQGRSITRPVPSLSVAASAEPEAKKSEGVIDLSKPVKA